MYKDTASKSENKKSSPFSDVFELPHSLRKIGPRQIQAFLPYVKSGLLYGLSTLLCITYMSDWKAVLWYLPYYNGKFKSERPKEPKHKRRAANEPEDGGEDA